MWYFVKCRWVMERGKLKWKYDINVNCVLIKKLKRLVLINKR